LTLPNILAILETTVDNKKVLELQDKFRQLENSPVK